MRLSRKGFNFLVLVWLAPAIAMAMYGNTVSTGATSDLYFWATGIFAALALFAIVQFSRGDYASNDAKRRASATDDLVSLDNIGAFEYIYCAVLALVAVGSFFYHHHVNKEAEGVLSVVTLLYSYFDLLIAGVSGLQFWRLKADSVKAAAKGLVSR